MNIADLIDIPAAWDGLTPESQASIGHAALAWQFNQYRADMTIMIPEMIESDAAAKAALEALAKAVEQAFPKFMTGRFA